jgi:hypothetical protein
LLPQQERFPTHAASSQAALGNSFVTLFLNQSQQIRLTTPAPLIELNPNPAQNLSPKHGLTEKGESNHEY